MSKLTYERAKQLYTPYNEGQMRHLCALRDVEIDRLRAENTTLRELVLALSDCRNTTCDDCVRWDYPEGGCTLDGVMRKLGIEVN